MGGHGGGSWKVAYADFVTAMMAFFLVMWIGAQDTKTRQSVANYFIDPSGVSKKPVSSGAVMDTFNGQTPHQTKNELGRGRESPDLPGEPSPQTKIVWAWITSDDKRLQTWLANAQAAKDAAAQSRDVIEGRLTAKQVAEQSLSKKLKSEITSPAATQTSGVFQDLLYGSFSDVNWTQLAQDLLR